MASSFSRFLYFLLFSNAILSVSCKILETWAAPKIVLTRICLCHQAVQFGTSREAAMSCDWEGRAEHWPCVTELSGLSIYGLKA